MGQPALVVGGTRGTGALIVQRLLQDGCRVRVLARNATRAKEALDPAVEIVEGDITRPESLPGAMKGVGPLIFTAGVTRRPAPEPLVKAINYDGLTNTLAAAKQAGFSGRFLYMTTISVTQPSAAAAFLDLMIRNTNHWRRLAEAELRRSGLDYTVIRAGMLTNDPEGRRGIRVTQDSVPLGFHSRISRAAVAEVFIQALRHPGTSRTSFNVVGGSNPPCPDWDRLFAGLKPDA